MFDVIDLSAFSINIIYKKSFKASKINYLIYINTIMVLFALYTGFSNPIY